LDVGGTIWPDQWPNGRAAAFDQRARLAEVFPQLPESAVSDLHDELEEAFAKIGTQAAQDTRATISGVLNRLGLVASAGPDSVRRAMCLPAQGRVELFEGAPRFLEVVRDAGLRCVVVSNAVVRDEKAYWQDFEILGIRDRIDAVVSSVDVNLRKPAPAIFEIAAERVGSRLEDCMVMGNSEWADIEPAAARGLFSIRVAIEEPPPRRTVADVVACSMSDAGDIVTSRPWLQ
jgi:FMN phosphatase YigB (HAD superfamily)